MHATDAVAPSNTHKQLVNNKAAQTYATHWQGTHPANRNSYYRDWGQDTGALLHNEHGQPDGEHPPHTHLYHHSVRTKAHMSTLFLRLEGTCFVFPKGQACSLNYFKQK